MGFEIGLLCALIVVFILSFCGLLQRIRQTYEAERIISEREARHQQRVVDGHDNTIFIVDQEMLQSSLPSVPPPPYVEVDLPPKYEDIMAFENHRDRTTAV